MERPLSILPLRDRYTKAYRMALRSAEMKSIVETLLSSELDVNQANG